ncbi:hypothetical protein NBT05_11335 [Aquimarina sp. ERC-38]|uniref:hypothetical protein n=1 Tax=Aquimarina sp. ERC-38 TaxID=2949996 RepID=UPI00224818A2|nr:hypothetical protein [Aquimarina sp. ERC-38]UZO79550.1 hypothetical protein NBT05_11335 [Aquimarina sp. ERC-38]
MKALIFYPFLSFSLFLSGWCSAQTSIKEQPIELKPILEISILSTETEHEHSHCEHALFKDFKSSHEITGIMSLDEIISSDDVSDFRCTGGFCMNEGHSHKKGLSFQKQLFNYFMKVSI